MTTSRRQQAESLFQQAADLPPDQRTPFLEEKCSGDRALREEVELLLRFHDQDGMESLRIPEDPESADAESVGDAIGSYKLLQVIGEGGFGTVYMAEQEQPIRRKVALKIIKLGMDTRQVIARFEMERQALALMDHPSIARVFDAGATATGRPYFVMELVKGVPITDFCDTNNLTTRERLELFTDVARAVQHAHNKGVIHRDLKPSNILVTMLDGRPVPKVIDFGVARATDRKLTDKTVFTRFGQFIGTPQYMSPEQAVISGTDVDTRSDVYSLGVLLYELLTGTTPLEPESISTKGLDEIQRLIREKDPQTPSQRLSTLGEELTDVSRCRLAEPRTLKKLIRGDLDWIVMKALEKNRSRRYETAESLAADVERHLRGEIVSAGPPSRLYRLRKLAVRHRVAFTGVAAFILLATGFGIWMAFLYAESDRLRVEAETGRTLAVKARADEEAQRKLTEANLKRAEAAEAQAVKEAETARQIADCLMRLFEGADPWRFGGSALSIRDLLDAGRERISVEMRDFPETQAALMETLGRVYTNLGHYDEAEELLEEALAIRRRLSGEEDAATLSAMNELGWLYIYKSKYAEAGELIEQVMETGRRVLGSDHWETFLATRNLSYVYTHLGRAAEAESLNREALEIARRTLAEGHPETITTMDMLVWLFEGQNRLDEAEALSRETVALSLRVHGEEHVSTAEAMNALALTLEKQGKYEEAEDLMRTAEAVRTRLLGVNHIESLESRRGLARILHSLRKHAEAEVQGRKALDGLLKTRGTDYYNTYACMTELALVCRDLEHYTEAEELLREAVASCARIMGPDHYRTHAFRKHLGDVLVSVGKHAEAESLLRDYIEYISGFPRESRLRNLHLAQAKSRLGACLAAQERFAEAEPLLIEGFESLSRELGETSRLAFKTLKEIVDLYEAWGNGDKAGEFRRRLEDLVDRIPDTR